MLSTIFKGVGGLIGDAYEATKYVGQELVDAPGALIDGMQEGFFTAPKEEAAPVTPVVASATPAEPTQAAPAEPAPAAPATPTVGC